MKKLSSLSLFFPALNDAESLPTLLARADRAARTVTNTYEIIVINDGSTDQTAVVLGKLRRRYRNLRVITHTSNEGYGAALISGFAAAKLAWVFYTDGDGQYDPMELIKLVKRATNNADVINGYKANRADGYMRKIIGSAYNSAVHMLYSVPIRDIDCDFRLIRRRMLQKITLRSTTGAICLELITKLHRAGARFSEVAVSHHPRLFGTSQFFQLNHLIETARALLTFKE